MNAAQRNRHAALLLATGYEDGPALTMQSTDGEIPHGRELSLAWLSGTVMTGLTSVLLMGAALYVSFQGQNTFSTAYEALRLAIAPTAIQTATDPNAKTDRVRPVARTRSELETIEASIRETVDGRDMIRNQPFMRIRATLATAATALSDDVQAYDPANFVAAPASATSAATEVNTDIYGAEVEGQVAVKIAAMPMSFVPPQAINDQAAALFVRQTVETAYSDAEIDPASGTALAYASPTAGSDVRELGMTNTDGVVNGVAENVTVMPKTIAAADLRLGRTERILTIKETTPLGDVLKKNGFTDAMVGAISTTLHNVFPVVDLPPEARLRILFGPSRTSSSLIPYRMSIYVHDDIGNTEVHRATVALTDKGQYVLGLAPAEINFPDEDTEEINVANLPSIYRSLWETGRKHDVSDDSIKRIIGMFAFDIDLTKKITAGDSIEILETPPDAAGKQELLYVGLTLGSTTKQLYRYASVDGAIGYFDPDGQTGKRFLNRRPLQGGGTVRSRFGYRIHPIFHTRKLHTGVDLAAPSGTPIYAAGDGTLEFAGWQNGYGNKIEIHHVNGFETAYGHMSRLAGGMKVGTRVRQGQVIGYVGTTGYSTGPHLHFEVKINGNLVDPLSVKLPRETTLTAQDENGFKLVVAQIDDLMQRQGEPTKIASN